MTTAPPPVARDLFSAPDPFADLAFAQPRTLANTPRDRLAHMVEAYSRAFLCTRSNVSFLRYMLARLGSLDKLAREHMNSPDWAEDFVRSMGQYYRHDCDYAEPLRAAVKAAGRWPWSPE